MTQFRIVPMILWIAVAASATVGDEPHRLTLTAAQITAAGRYPPAALRPVEHGFDEIYFTPGDYTAVPFNPTQPARFMGTRESILGAGTLNVSGQPESV